MPTSKRHKSGLVEFFRTPDELEKIQMQEELESLKEKDREREERLAKLEALVNKLGLED